LTDKNKNAKINLSNETSQQSQGKKIFLKILKSS
jgi:hypothetical protein